MEHTFFICNFRNRYRKTYVLIKSFCRFKSRSPLLSFAGSRRAIPFLQSGSNCKAIPPHAEILRQNTEKQAQRLENWKRFLAPG